MILLCETREEHCNLYSMKFCQILLLNVTKLSLQSQEYGTVMIQGLVFIKTVMFSLEWPQENTVAWEMKQKITIARAKEYIISLHVSLTDIHILYSFSSQLSFDNRCSHSCKQRKFTTPCFVNKQNDNNYFVRRYLLSTSSVIVLSIISIYLMINFIINWLNLYYWLLFMTYEVRCSFTDHIMFVYGKITY